MPFHFSLMSEEESYDNVSTDQEPYEEELYDDEEEDQYIDKASNERFKEINKNIVQLYDKSLAIFAKFQYDDFNEQYLNESVEDIVEFLKEMVDKLENHLLD